MVIRHAKVEVVRVDIVYQLIHNLVQDHTAFAEPNQDQGKVEHVPVRHSQLTFGMNLRDEVQQQSFQVQQTPVAMTISRDANYRRLDEVVEAAKERAEHARRTNYPDGRVWELAFKQCQGVLQTPWLPLADFFILGFHLYSHVLHQFQGGRAVIR